jgi:hypothetical protein
MRQCGKSRPQAVARNSAEHSMPVPFVGEETAMAKFYISFRNGGELAEDQDGTELPSLTAAKELAMMSARELLADNINRTPNPVEAIIITDGARAYL